MSTTITHQYHQNILLQIPRSSSCNSTSSIFPSTSTTSPSPPNSLLPRRKPPFNLSHFLKSLLSHIFITILPTPRRSWLSHLPPTTRNPLGRKFTGTLFGHRRGHVSFSIQDDPRSDPVFIIQMAISTSALVREMSSGMVRIALECEKSTTAGRRLFGEAVWTMYCNGKKCGYAPARACTESDWHVLRMVRSVSVGAGVIPVVMDGGKCGEGELLYMRARFERVVGSRDSEAFYMMNPDGNCGPELSIFLLRL